MDKMDIFGGYRSIEPPHTLPQAAWRLDNSTELRPTELLLDVDILCINRVSFNQILDEAGGDDRAFAARVMDIVHRRGKLHNPVTGSGGMLFGRVSRMGARYPNPQKLAPGDQVISLASMTITPLEITRIISIDYAKGLLYIEGQCVLFARASVIKRPLDLPLALVVTLMDEAGAPTRTCRTLNTGDRVLILGAGGKMGMLCTFAARDRLGPDGVVDGLIRRGSADTDISQSGLFTHIYQADANDSVRGAGAFTEELREKYDVVVNCVSSAGTELASLLAVRDGGTIYFSTLSCDYKLVALTAESISKSVNIIPYTGYMEGHAEYTLELLRKFMDLTGYFMPNDSVSAFQAYPGDGTHVYAEDDMSSVTEGYVFESAASRRLLAEALKVAQYDCNIVISGESGSGKEIIAQIIHRNSAGRKNFPMVKINCAAIPESLLESELFGYERGSFTGANPKGKMGLWEAANNGTLFLDEVSEMPLSFQAKLLRVIQEKEIIRVGGISPIKVDVRIVASTNKDLAELVNRGLFREDLYYRLNVFPLNVLPLRERRDDVIPLVKYFTEHYNMKFRLERSLTPEALELMQRMRFPGNVRELQNLIQRLMVSVEHRDICPADIIASSRQLYGEASGEPAADGCRPGAASEGGMSLQAIIDSAEEKALRESRAKYGSTRKMADALGISQPTVVRKLRRYNIA